MIKFTIKKIGLVFFILGAVCLTPSAILYACLCRTWEPFRELVRHFRAELKAK